MENKEVKEMVVLSVQDGKVFYKVSDHDEGCILGEVWHPSFDLSEIEEGKRPLIKQGLKFTITYEDGFKKYNVLGKEF